MSVLVIVKVQGDTAVFRKALDERPEEFKQVVVRAQGAGAIHHRFGVGDGYVIAVDEWASSEQFEAFFGDPAMHEFMGSIGGDTSRQPEITVTEALETVDQF